ncbi:uncharacterized protein [Pseudorasbora parva]|uniref:uncharacterized protein n=1 Tax=Pseudorasbora parva TaxID=51549 RepID=UPI00351E047D
MTAMPKLRWRFSTLRDVRAAAAMGVRPRPFTTTFINRGEPFVEQPCVGWLDKFCTDLGCRNLTYLPDSCCCTTTTTDPGFDTTDGCFTDVGFKIVKATIAVLLQHLIDGKLKEQCQGCATGHPSQLQHSCLFEPPAYFFDANFDELSSKLFKPDLRVIIACTLRRCGLKAHLQRIQGTAGAILHELRDAPYIGAKLQEIRDTLLDKSFRKDVYDAVDLWQSRPTANGV